MLILVAAFVAIGALLSDSLTTEVGFTNNPESKRAETLLEERLRGPDQTNEIVIVRSGEKTVDDAEFQDTVESVYGGVIGLGPEIVEGGTNFYQSGDETLVSADRHTTILPFVMAGDHEDALDNIPPVLDVVDEADAADSTFDVIITGGATLNNDFDTIAEKDLQTGETIGIPIALLILLLVFGALTAALIPLVLGILSIVVAVGLTALFGQAFQFSFFVVNVIGMMGSGGGYRLRALHRLPLPRGAQPRTGKDRRDRGVRLDREPRRFLQRHHRRAGAGRDADHPVHHLQEPRGGRHHRCPRLRRGFADASARGPGTTGRQG